MPCNMYILNLVTEARIEDYFQRYVAVVNTGEQMVASGVHWNLANNMAIKISKVSETEIESGI